MSTLYDLLKKTENWTLILLAASRLLLPFVTHSDFGLHRDEFLYLAMGDHLDWGYLEVPPFIAFLSWLLSVFTQPPIELVRFLPALSGAVTIFLTGLIARQIGGGLFAQLISASAFVLSLVFLRINNLYQPVTFDLMFFVIAVYLFTKILQTNAPRTWIMLGVTVGIGLLNKYTMLLFPFGAAIGVMLTPHRNLIKEKWLWLSAGIAMVIWLPNLIWQHQNGWPFIEHMRALSAYQLSNVNPLIFTLVQFLMNIHAFWLWIIGLIYFLFSVHAKQWRPLGWIFISLYAVLLILSGKTYYLVAAYPMLFAGGAVALERFKNSKSRRWVLPLVLFLFFSGSLPMIPVGIPIFSVQGMVNYFAISSKYLGTGEALRWEDGEKRALPQDFADMLGWEEQVHAVAKTYYSVLDTTQDSCAIFAANYGQAGAIDYYGPSLDLPKSISKGSSYWLWGYREYTGKCLIVVGFNEEETKYFYETVLPGVSYYVPYAREDDTAIYIARDPKVPIDSLWQILKAYRY